MYKQMKYQEYLICSTETKHYGNMYVHYVL